MLGSVAAPYYDAKKKNEWSPRSLVTRNLWLPSVAAATHSEKKKKKTDKKPKP